jgi:outer membrane protein assembly factor BamB
MVTIDLGVLSEEPPEPPSRGYPPRSRRTAAILVGLALTGGLLSASGRPADGALPGVRLPADGSDQYFRAGDRLLVLAPEVSTDSAVPQTLTAYTAPGGERLWQRTLEPRFGVMWVQDLDDVLLLMLQNWSNEQRALAVDPATGATRWSRASGWPISAENGAVVLSAESNDPATPVGWEAVRASDGEVLWRREFPPLSYGSLLPDGTGRVLMTLPDMEIQVWDPAANRMLSSTRLPEAAGVTMDADRALAVNATFGRADVTGYSLPGLERLWRHEYPDGLQLTSLCGPEVLCAATDGQGKVRVLDPGSGDVLWESEAYSWIFRAGPVLLGVGADRVGAVLTASPLVALDLRTGRAVKDFGRWQLIDFETSHLTGDPVVVARYDPAQNTAIVAALDPRALTLRVLVQVRGTEDCMAERDVLLCRFADGAIGMWDLAAAR